MIKLWTWDDPYGLAKTHPNIHQMGNTIIRELPTDRWKNTLPSLEGSGATLLKRVAPVTTGPEDVIIPVHEAQEIARQVLARNQGPGEVGITLNRYGSPGAFRDNSGTLIGAPFIGLLFQSILDAPQDWFSSYDSEWYTKGKTTPAEIDPNTIAVTKKPVVENAPDQVSVGCLFTANGVEYWRGWLNEFCIEWKRLQAEDPAFVNLPDPTAFWLDTEIQNELGNIHRRWGQMLADPRADDLNAMPGMTKTLREIHLEIRAALEPSQRLPEVGGAHESETPGVVVDGFSAGWPYAGWITTYPEWSSLAGPWVHAIEAAAMKIVADNEIFPHFPTALVSNWYTSSNHREIETSGGNTVSYIRPDGHGTHASHVFYSAPIEIVDEYNNSNSPKPQAPWVFHPARWGATADNALTPVNNWSIDAPGATVNLSQELQQKYASEIGGVSGDAEATNLLMAKIYWNEAIPRFVDAGVQHFLLWNDPGSTAAIDTTAAGNILVDVYEKYMLPAESNPSQILFISTDSSQLRIGIN